MESNTMEICNLNDRKTFVASDSLLEKAREKKANMYINLAYTNYGGTFYDKVLIDYLIENFPNNIVWENTSWNGMNAFVFGNIAKALIDESLPDFETYYYNREHEEKLESIADFIGWNKDNITNEERAKERLYDFASSNCSVETFGLDYCESNFINYLKDNELWKQ